MKYIVGIDEAGRGPLAGPVTVGIVSLPIDFDWSLLSGVGDSKKIKLEKREEIFHTASRLRREGKINFQVISSDHLMIDNKGIVFAINRAIKQGMKKLELDPSACRILLDGSLKAPNEFNNQETIIKGDAKEPVIGLASILAKVTRDSYMNIVARKLELKNYGFETHKGYGTKKHIELIKKYGLSDIHRKSYCRNIQV